MLEPAIRALLLGDTAISGMVCDRVRPLAGAQLDKRPFLTIQTTNNQGNITHSGAVGSFNAVVEIGIIADAYADVSSLSTSVGRVLGGYVGLSGGIAICPSVLDDETDIEQTLQPGQPKPIYLKTVSYRVRYKNVT